MKDPEDVMRQLRTSQYTVRLNQTASRVWKELSSLAALVSQSSSLPSDPEATVSRKDVLGQDERSSEPAESSSLSEIFVQLAIDQWRLKRRIQRLEAASPEANVSSITDSAQRIGEGLQELGVTTAEHDGAIHDPGALYEVVHIRDECDTQVVVETIAPSVLINGKIVKHGQVVIGCESTEESGT